MSSLKKPRAFGNYRLLEKLREEGPCISVFRAHQPVLDREVELRALTVPGGPETPLGRRFVAELKVLAALDHPALLDVLDLGVVGRHLFFATPLRRAEPLRSYLLRCGGRLPPQEFLAQAETLTAALVYLHGEGVIHRGLSSTSVHVDLELRAPYVAECSAIRDIRKVSLTADGVPPLNELCVTPESALGKPADARTDVFLLCALFCEMLTGEAPYPREERRLFDLVDQHGAGLAALVSDLEKRLETCGLPGAGRLLLHGLQPDPDARLQTAAALHAEVVKLRRGLVPTAAPPPVGAPPSTKSGSDAAGTSPPGPRPKAAALALAAAAVVFGVLVLSSEPARMPPPPSPPPAPSEPFDEPATPEKRVEDADLLKLSFEVDVAPSTKDSVADRLAVFRAWLVANRSAGAAPCRYTDFMALRRRCLESPSPQVLADFDSLVKRAAILVRAGPQ